MKKIFVITILLVGAVFAGDTDKNKDLDPVKEMISAGLKMEKEEPSSFSALLLGHVYEQKGDYASAIKWKVLSYERSIREEDAEYVDPFNEDLLENSDFQICSIIGMHKKAGEKVDKAKPWIKKLRHQKYAMLKSRVDDPKLTYDEISFQINKPNPTLFGGPNEIRSNGVFRTHWYDTVYSGKGEDFENHKGDDHFYLHTSTNGYAMVEYRDTQFANFEKIPRFAGFCTAGGGYTYMTVNKQGSIHKYILYGNKNAYNTPDMIKIDFDMMTYEKRTLKDGCTAERGTLKISFKDGEYVFDRSE